MGSNYKTRGVLGSPLVYCCQSLLFFQWNVKRLNDHYYVKSFVFYQKQNVGAFIIILGVTLKAVAFESLPGMNGFVEKLVIFS